VRLRREAATTQNPGEPTAHERGAVLFILFLFLAIFLGVAALAVDLASIATRGQTLQNTADAAALAGVVEYEEQLVNGASEADARAAAADVVDEVMAQNGIDSTSSSINVLVEFPAGGGQVTVTIEDEDPPSYLGGTVIPGFDASVDRVATAEFLGCEACAITVEIPKPFSSVNVAGSGDGYKPIDVRNRLYALNHNSPARQIVCVDRRTQEPCWLDGAGGFDISRTAYAPGSYSDPNPEMPHTAVVNNRIYWSASDSSGHRLFCFQTALDAQVDQPCSSSWQLGNDRRVYETETPLLTSPKDENRGGGTVAVGDKVFVFTDNHEIHCFDPAINSYCSAFQGAGPAFRQFGGKPTALDIFPDSDPLEGNHGSSIDRVVDESTGYIYSTIHIPNAVDSLKCSAGFAVTETNVDDLIDEIVVIRAAGGEYLSAVGTDAVTLATLTGDFSDTSVRWRVTRDVGDTAVYLEAVGLASDDGLTQEWLDGQADPLLLPAPLGTDFNRTETDNQWNLVHDGLGFTIENEALPSFINATPLGAAIQEELSTTRWEISRCTNPAVDAGYQAGTWLHCYDTGVVSGVPAPCPGFAPSVIHVDWTRFSGRLFFYYSSGTPIPIGVCSTGYSTPRDLAPALVEIQCVDLVDGSPNTLGTNMNSLTSEINAFTATDPGAWGDPHYNAFQNRLFYPTEHNTSRIVCWDFNAVGMCGSIEGQTHPSPLSITTEDYGFVSDDNCVFALGHNAQFWAFQASALGEPCVGATSETPIHQCPCTNGATRWGVLDFEELDLTDFDVFNVQITSNPPDPDVPGLPYTSVRELKNAGVSRLINLDDETGIPDDATSLRVAIYVEAENDPFAFTIPTFEIRFLQLPRLVE